MSIRDQIPDNIKRASKAIGLALWLQDADAWARTTTILAVRLSPLDREALALACTFHLPAVTVGVGAPVAPLRSAMDDATFWADMADAEELEAYCLASFNRMAPHRQAAFLNFARGRAAA